MAIKTFFKNETASVKNNISSVSAFFARTKAQLAERIKFFCTLNVQAIYFVLLSLYSYGICAAYKKYAIEPQKAKLAALSQKIEEQVAEIQTMHETAIQAVPEIASPQWFFTTSTVIFVIAAFATFFITTHVNTAWSIRNTEAILKGLLNSKAETTEDIFVFTSAFAELIFKLNKDAMVGTTAKEAAGEAMLKSLLESAFE